MRSIVTVTCLLTGILASADYRHIPLLRWAGPAGSAPETRESWMATHPAEPFVWTKQDEMPGDGRQGLVAIITQQSIAAALAGEISQLMANLQSEGYSVQSYTCSGGTAESLRTVLRDLYTSQALEGALFVGSLPIAWFEIANDYGIYGYADFPMDLFFMDLDGTWLDTMTTGNGKYDGHTGNIAPEIYVGRLLPTGIGTDTIVLKNYFRKDNAFRHDTIMQDAHALFFCDDDWAYWGPQWSSEVALLYPDTTNFWDEESTRASIYRRNLNTPQAWVAMFAHSWPGGHQFIYNGGGSYDYYYANEYQTQNPPVNFYNHFACSFARYTTAGYGGGCSVFNESYGLGAIGSTKTGSMLDFYYFYSPLAAEKTLGEAFRDWFAHITDNGVTFDELCWHYGMTLLADPWLKPTGHIVAVAEAHEAVVAPAWFMASYDAAQRSVSVRIAAGAPTVRITIHDAAGRIVWSSTAVLSPERTQIEWPCVDRNGRCVPAGTYFVSGRCRDQLRVRKVVVY